MWGGLGVATRIQGDKETSYGAVREMRPRHTLLSGNRSRDWKMGE